MIGGLKLAGDKAQVGWISPRAVVGEGVELGCGVVVEDGVHIGAGCVLGHYVVVHCGPVWAITAKLTTTASSAELQ
jgi:UDP-3-O-[3-hydroxymyristoyl] glucosamine N-acyltransferase